MTMKKDILILCALSLLCSCMRQDETGSQVTRANSLTAVISDNSTRAILIDNPGVKVESFWEDGDAIGIFGAGAANTLLSITAADISEDGKTAEFKSTANIPAGDLIALSPYSADATDNGTEISFTFPAVQHLASGHGVPQADPESNIMVGRGSRTTGVKFTNVMSILKTGMCFDQATVLRSIEFRDLSGSSVSGQAVIKWSDNTPTAEFAGQGGIITLDLGEEGLTLEAGEVRPFYLIVPARNYTKGFEITFVTKEGERIAKVSGTKMGKELCSGVLYTVGDIDSQRQIPGAKSVLKSNATVMTADKLDLIQITKISSSPIYTDGQYLEGPSGRIYAPEVTAIVHRDLQPAVGNWMLFDQHTSDMPKGALLKIKSCKQLDTDHFEIWAVSDPDVAAPFEELVAGTPLYDEAGNELEDGGFEIDASQIESIVDRLGNPVEFSLNSNGDLIFDGNTTSKLLGTRAVVNHTFTTPSLSKTLEGRGCEMTIGARMNLGMKAALGIVHGEFQYIHMVCNPKIEINASFSLKGEAYLEESFHFITLKFTPIIVAPGFVCIPQLEIWGKLGVGGELEFQTSLTYTKDLGSFGLSYNKGDGITVRHSLEPNSSDDVSPFVPQIGGLTGSINAVPGLEFRPGISVYGLLSCGVKCDCTLKFGLISNGTYLGRKFALTPEVELSPYIYSLGGILNKTFNSMAKIQCDPVWEKYITPKCKINFSKTNFSVSSDAYMMDIGDMAIVTKVPTSATGIDYDITLTGDAFSNFTLGIKYWDASDVKYSPWMDDSFTVDQWKAAGLEGVGLWLGSLTGEPVGLTESGTEILGTYEAGTEEMKFSGSVNHAFANNSAHGYSFFIQQGDEILDIGYGSSNHPYNVFAVYWPNRSNGMPYQETD